MRLDGRDQGNVYLGRHIAKADQAANNTHNPGAAGWLAPRAQASEAVVAVSGQNSKAMSDQMTTVAKERLSARLGVLTKADMKIVEHVIKIQLGLPL
jgi:mRNA-degrading endonuclease toxin of MazEF toxin-antitoxin module